MSARRADKNRGVVDQVFVQTGNDVFIRVVDYKTGQGIFPDDIKDGLGLQLLLYLCAPVSARRIPPRSAVRRWQDIRRRVYLCSNSPLRLKMILAGGNKKYRPE